MALINLRNALMAGKRTPTAQDYVQDGLIAMWDGIENAGWSVHDPNATTWKNLIGDTAWDMTVPAAWQNDGLYFDGTWCGKAPKTSETAITMECVCDPVVANFPMAFGWSYQGGVKRYSLLSNASSSLLRCYVGNSVFDGVFSATAHSYAVVIGATQSKIFVDGVLSSTSTSAVGVSGETSNRFRLGGYGTRTDGDASGFFYKGHVQNFRISIGELTADEIAANYAIDKARFNLP